MRVLVGFIVVTCLCILGMAGVVGYRVITSPARPRLNPLVQLISTGERVDIGSHVQDRGFTVIQFVSPSVDGVRAMAQRLNTICATNPELRLRVVDIGSPESPVARQYGIEKVPVLWLYKDGTLVTSDTESVWRRLEGPR